MSTHLPHASITSGIFEERQLAEAEALFHRPLLGDGVGLAGHELDQLPRGLAPAGSAAAAAVIA